MKDITEKELNEERREGKHGPIRRRLERERREWYNRDKQVIDAPQGSRCCCSPQTMAICFCLDEETRRLSLSFHHFFFSLFIFFFFYSIVVVVVVIVVFRWSIRGLKGFTSTLGRFIPDGRNSLRDQCIG